MSDVITVEKVTLTSHCKCYDCTNPDCYELNISNEYEPECDSCQSPTKPANYCDGYCFESDNEYADDLFNTWLSNNGEPTYVRIEGNNIGWQHLSGYAIAQGTWKHVFNKMRFNGDWTLEITTNGNEFNIRRSSHDEPTGASFRVVPTTEEE